MSYWTVADSAPLAAALTASLPRDKNGLFVVEHGGRIERTARAEVALLLVLHGTVGKPRAQRSTRQVGALERAQQAIARADAAVGKTRDSALSKSERAAVDKLPNAAVIDVFGSVLGRELAVRDRRLLDLESRLGAAPTERADTLSRARAALRHAEAVL